MKTKRRLKQCESEISKQRILVTRSSHKTKQRRSRKGRLGEIFVYNRTSLNIKKYK